MQRTTPSRQLNFRSKRLLVLSALVAITGSVIGAAALLARPPSVPPSAAAAQGGLTPPRLECELVTLKPTGFEPRQITRPAGRFILMVSNSSRRDVVLRLSAGLGAPLRQISLSRYQPDWNDVMLLPVGQYTLTEVSHPGWVCRIAVGVP